MVEKIAKINGFSKESNNPIIEFVSDLIRCKDCKHRPISGSTDNHDLVFPDERCPCNCVDDNWYSWMPEDNWYCGNGERKEE